LIAAGSVALVIGGLTASRSSAFDVRGVEVSGSHHLHGPQIVRVAGISGSTNALWLDEGVSERRLEAQPWIADADVRVTFPLNVEIVVRERSPVAVAEGRLTSLMAADGTALGSVSAPRGLPVIELGNAGRVEGVRSPVGAARALGAMTPALRARVARVRVLLDGTLELRLRVARAFASARPQTPSARPRRSGGCSRGPRAREHHFEPFRSSPRSRRPRRWSIRPDDGFVTRATNATRRDIDGPGL